VIYGLIVFGLGEYILWDAQRYEVDAKFIEFGFTEYGQTTLLFCSCLILWVVYQKYRPLKYVALLMFGFLGSALIREQDVYFEDYIGQSTWQIPVYVLISYVLYQVIRHFKQFLKELPDYIQSYSFGIFTMGFLMTFVFSRLFGRKTLWYAIMEDRYFRDVKNAAEEGLELFGYLILLFAVIELFILAHKMNKEPRLNLDFTRPVAAKKSMLA